MKTNFKPLGLAAAVAAASAGYAGVATAAAAVSSNGLGDMALIPYYTVMGDQVTGVHIINTSQWTQVVKLRLRRATDSMDALDFNLVMSPQDEWTGFLTGGDGEAITFNTGDTTCTVPAAVDGTFTMPIVYRAGADTGYIEVIGMGTADPNQPIHGDALHDSDGVPNDCTAVRTNFFASGVAGSKKGVISSVETAQFNVDAKTQWSTNDYTNTGDVLKVSYFVRDQVAGVEFGNDAVHFSGFLDDASITNQEFGLFSGDLQGFDFPDLNGGAPASSLAGIGAARNKYEDLRSAIGGAAVINDWSAAQSDAGFTVGTDWVITVPGQYVMLDFFDYLRQLADAVDGEDKDDFVCKGNPVAPLCDNRDIPLTAAFTVYDREEQGIIQEEGDLVVSPSIPGVIPTTLLDQEVNVIEWGVESVLDAPKVVKVGTPGDAINGWASLAVTADKARFQSICDYVPDPNDPVVCTAVVDKTDIPLVGFVAWERSFAANPDANYGRIVEHSYTSTASGS